MRFSSRVPSNLAPNRFAVALARARQARRPLIDLTVSNPTEVGLAYPADMLAPLAASAGLRYEPQPFGLLSAREAVAEDYLRRNVRVSADRVVLTASTSEAYSILFKLLCDPGDRVLVPRPSYPLFEHLTRLDGVEADGYLLEYHGRWSVNEESVRRAVSPRTRAILAVSPNNPTGSFLDARDLDALAAVCAENDLALIGDEVFSDYPLGASERQPADSVLSRRDILTFSLGGLSKSAGLPQLKLGWVAVSCPDSAVLGDTLDRLEVICDSYLSVGTPVQLALGPLLAHAPVVRAQIGVRIDQNYRALLRLAVGYPSIAVLPAEGGWYGVVRVPATRSEEDLVLDLLDGDGVAVHPGYFFDFASEAYLVVSLLPPPELFERGVARLLARAAS